MASNVHRPAYLDDPFRGCDPADRNRWFVERSQSIEETDRCKDRRNTDV